MSNVVRLGANLEKTMTIGEGLDEIARMRRQMERFEYLPTNGGPSPDPDLFKAARQILDGVEARVKGEITE
jgi:hypothetical protein